MVPIPQSLAAGVDSHLLYHGVSVCFSCPGVGTSLLSLNCCRTLTSKGMVPHLASSGVSPLCLPRIPTPPSSSPLSQYPHPFPHPPPTPGSQMMPRPTYPDFSPQGFPLGNRKALSQRAFSFYHRTPSSERCCHHLSTDMPPTWCGRTWEGALGGPWPCPSASMLCSSPSAGLSWFSCSQPTPPVW